MKRNWVSFATLTAPSLLIPYLCGIAQETPGKTAAELHVAIVANRTDADFPFAWRQPPRHFHAEPYAYAESVNLVAAALRGEFDKYPRSILATHLEEIDIFSTLSLYGISAGGTYIKSRKTILLLVQSKPDILRTFHHEFSSILLLEHFALLDYDAWISSLPPAYKYHDAVGSGFTTHTNLLPSDEWAEKGFAAEYSTTSLEDDFNVIAQNLFLPYPGFWKLVDGFPKLRAKVLLVIKFYHALDGRFTEKYFRDFEVDDPVLH